MDNEILETLPCVTKNRQYFSTFCGSLQDMKFVEMYGGVANIIEYCKQMQFLIQHTPQIHPPKQQVLDTNCSKYKFKGLSLKTQSQKIIYNVFAHCKKSDSSENKAIMTAAKIIGMSRGALRKIVQRVKSGDICTPGKHRKSTKPVLDAVTRIQKDLIRNKILESYRQKKVPTVARLLISLEDADEVFHGSETSFQRVLKEMGYKFGSLDDKLHIIQKPNVVTWRFNYLLRLKQNRESEHPLPEIFIDETWIDWFQTIKKGYYPKSGSKSDLIDHSFKKKPGRSPRIIILHAGGENGFVEGAELIKDSKTENIDYHKEMDEFGFTNWFTKLMNTEQLKRQKHLLIMDNASYHSVSDLPKSRDKKEVMSSYLQRKDYDVTRMTRAKMWNTIKDLKMSEPSRKIDELAKKFNHEIVRLPPYHPQFNPIEFVWHDIKHAFRDGNKTNNVAEAMERVKEIMQGYNSTGNWKKHREHCKNVEEETMRDDGIYEVLLKDKIIIPLDDSDDSDCEFDSAAHSSAACNRRLVYQTPVPTASTWAKWLNVFDNNPPV